MSAMSLFMAKWRSDNSSGWPVVSDSDFLFRPLSSRFSIAYSVLLEAMMIDDERKESEIADDNDQS